MRRSEKFLLGLVVLVSLCLPCYAVSGDVTLTQSEFQTLKTALQMADKQLTESETLISNLQEQLKESQEKSMTLQTECLNLQTQCENLQAQLKTQDEQLGTLTMQLDSALASLKKLKKETTINNVILVIVAVAGIALGGTVSYLIFGGK